METDAFSIEAFFDFLSNNQKVISIIGMEKNVGKTTLLNYLLRGLADKGLPVLILSIGRDGESVDALEKTKKPGIMVYNGGCFLTIRELLKTPSAVEILETFNEKVSGSKVLLARALQKTEIQLINPGNQKVVSRMIHSSFNRCGKCTVLIDGALDRLSHGASNLVDGVFICTGVQVEGTLVQIIEKTKELVDNLENSTCTDEIKRLISDCKAEFGTVIIRNHHINACMTGTLLDSTELDEKIKNNDIIYTTGVLTDKIIKRFGEKDLRCTIVLIDGTKCHVSQRAKAMMTRKGIDLKVLNQIPVYGLSVNSVGIRRSMNPSKVLMAFKEVFKDKWVFDTQYFI
jgi:aerobic-type carbon monoxide dehydrogenase small subunit (CoxS/CutS family)